MKAIFLVAGVLFGFLLSRARATDYDTMLRFFLLEDPHILVVMGVAMAVAAIGLYALRKTGATAVVGCAIDVPHKPMRKWLFAASLVFGAGWALTGT